MELGGTWENASNNYVDGLEYGGIRLKSSADQLVWAYNKKEGKVTATMAYELMVNTLLAPVKYKFAVLLWHCKFPWKIKCFIWLLINNKIITWDNLSRRGWIGLSRCPLCASGEYSIQHIFMDCIFTISVF